MIFYGSRGLCHLHKRNYPLLHTCPSGTAKHKYRQLFFCCALDRCSDFFSVGMSHAGHHKPRITNTDHRVFSIDPAFSDRYTFTQAGFFPCILQFFFITLIPQRVTYRLIRKPLFKGLRISYHTNPVFGAHTEISTTLITYKLTFYYAFFVHHFSAFGTFYQSRILLMRIFGFFFCKQLRCL